MDTRNKAIALLKEKNLNTTIVDEDPDLTDEICRAIQELAKQGILNTQNLTFLRPSTKTAFCYPLTTARALIFLHEAGIHDERIKKLAAQGNEGYSLAKDLKDLKFNNIEISADIVSLFETNMRDKMTTYLTHILKLTNEVQLLKETIDALKAKTRWENYLLNNIESSLKLLQANDQLDKFSIKLVIEYYANPSLANRSTIGNFAHDIMVARKEGLAISEINPEKIPLYSIEKIMTSGITQFKTKRNDESSTKFKQLEDTPRKTI